MAHIYSFKLDVDELTHGMSKLSVQMEECSKDSSHKRADSDIESSGEASPTGSPLMWCK